MRSNVASLQSDLKGTKEKADSAVNHQEHDVLRSVVDRKAEESRARAIQLAQRIPQQYANSDFAYRAQRLLYLLQQKIPTYGNAAD